MEARVLTKVVLHSAPVPQKKEENQGQGGHVGAVVAASCLFLIVSPLFIFCTPVVLFFYKMRVVLLTFKFFYFLH
jgi:hypothetical protein